jgi:tRNA A37 threonylcarbamoyladenosine synthetase subunit TsaC/SUA5/YrdC
VAKGDVMADKQASEGSATEPYDGAQDLSGTDPGVAGEAGDSSSEPPVVASGAHEVAGALDDGAVIAVPGVGGYCLAVRTGSHEREERLADLAADPEGPHYAVGHRDDVRALTSAWNDELGQLLERCWPGPVEVFMPRSDAGIPYDVEADSGAWAVTVGMPDGRALRKLCREHGPWRTVPLRLTDAREVAHAFAAGDVACVVDGGRREGEPPTVVDATVTPVRVLRSGALPANFIDATMAMGSRRRLFSRSRSKGD